MQYNYDKKDIFTRIVTGEKINDIFEKNEPETKENREETYNKNITKANTWKELWDRSQLIDFSENPLFSKGYKFNYDILNSALLKAANIISGSSAIDAYIVQKYLIEEWKKEPLRDGPSTILFLKKFPSSFFEICPVCNSEINVDKNICSNPDCDFERL